MPFPHFGEICSVLSAVSWSLAIVLFRRAGDVPAQTINLFKNSLGLLLTVSTLLALGRPFHPLSSREDLFRLLVSGILGLGLADILFLAALKRIGSSLAAVVETIYAPSVVLFAVLLNGEKVRDGLWIGAPLVLLGVLIASEPWRKNVDLAEGGVPTRRVGLWVLLAAFALVLMALGIVIAKPALEGRDVFEATVIRMVGALSFQFVLVMFSPNRMGALRVFLPGPIWSKVLPSTLLGTYVAMLFWLSGMKHAPASVSALLTQTSTAFTLLFSWLIYRERLGLARVLGMVLAFAGAAILVRLG